MAIEYRLLGPLEVLGDGRPAKLAGPRQPAVLVCLLTRPNSVVPVARLVDYLWGETPRQTAANAAQSYVCSCARRSAATPSRPAARAMRSGSSPTRSTSPASNGSFHRATSRSTRAGRPRRATTLREALSLWRGARSPTSPRSRPIAPIVDRLEDLRVLALERRLEADLDCGRHAEVVAEAGELAEAHPLREGPRRLHMLALYRSGRQAEALDAYRRARETLVAELGLEPGAGLQGLERATLQQDASLEREACIPGRRAEPRPPARSSSSTSPPDRSTGSSSSGRRLRSPFRHASRCAIQTVPDADELASAGTALRAVRSALLDRGVDARAAVFTSLLPGADLARLAGEQDADLILAGAPEQLLEDGRLLGLLTHAPCDVGVVVGHAGEPGDVFVAFSGGEHDWAAVELGAWFARSSGSRLLLAGASVGPEGRDASRLLASASMAVQRGLGVDAEPALVPPSPPHSSRRRRAPASLASGSPTAGAATGSGATRNALATRAEGPTILARRGVRPGALAPRRAETRYTWTIAG